MSAQALRAAAPGDEAQLRALWQAVFGDEDAVLDAFFDCLYRPEDVLLAEHGGEIISAAYLLRGVELCAEGERRPAAYFYALATRPDSRGRGLGAAVTRCCMEAAAGRGETLCLMPGEESLRRWYAAFAGLRSFGTWRELVCPAADAPELRLTALDPGEYLRLREALLAKTPHAALPEAFFRFQARLSALSGAWLLHILGPEGREGLACAEREGERVWLPELLWSGEDPAPAAAACAAALGVAEARARTPGEGDKSVMAVPPTPPSPFWWGPVFD